MENNEQKNLREILNEAIESRGLNIERLAQLTDIPDRYLTALCEGDFNKLPAAPYVRGYLMKIGEVLNIDGRRLWSFYKDQNPVRASGMQDRLPTNRFAIRRRSRKLIVLGIISIVVIIYLGWRWNDFWGTPQIEIANPVLDNFVVKISPIKLAGTISNHRDKLLINGEEVLVDPAGHFEKNFSLEPGVNTVEFDVKRFLGKETKVVKQIIYQPQ